MHRSIVTNFKCDVKVVLFKFIVIILQILPALLHSPTPTIQNSVYSNEAQAVKRHRWRHSNHFRLRQCEVTVLSVIEYRLQQYMKSILKDQAAIRSKGTLSKAPLRVTFTFDQNDTQRESAPINYPLSWMRRDPQPAPNQKIIVKQNAKQVEVEKRVDFWKEEDEFRQENIEWNGFVLVYNPKFTLSTFFCGKCQQSFERVVDFTFHSLTECGEISHSKSSHFIFDRKEWLRFVDQQRTKAVETAITVKPQSLPVKVTYEERMKEIRAFTESTLVFWRETDQQENFYIDQHYQFDSNLVMLINPLSQDYFRQYIKAMKAECPRREKGQTRKHGAFIRDHFYSGECCRINTDNAAFLLLDAGLFHSYLIETGRFKLEDKRVNLPCLLHLHNQPASREQVEQAYPKFKYYRVYIQLFYEMRQPFYKTKPDSALVKEYGKTQLIVFYKFLRSFRVALFWDSFKQDIFYCPCENFSTAMTLSQFAAHLTQNPHHTIKIADLFTQ